MPQTTNLPNPKETDKKKKKKKKLSLKNLAENNRFIFGCSVVLAFVLWCLVSVYASPVEERTITNVPVTIDLTDSTPERLGLQPFGETEFFVDVTVRGPRYQVSENMLSADNIRVTANVNYVDTAGQKELNLRCEIVDSNADVEVVGMSRESVSVYFDTLREAVFTLEPDIIFPDGVDPVPDGYILDNSILSVSTVTVSGPTTEVNKIRRVVARVENEASLTATTTAPAEIYMLTEDNTSPSYCTCATEDVTVTMLVKKIVTVPVRVDFTHAPIDYLDTPLSHTISPATVVVALNADIADSTTALSVGTIDYADIQNQVNTFTFPTAEIENAIFLDDSLQEFTVTIDASTLSRSEYSVTLTGVTSVNLPSSYTASYSLDDTYTVAVVGPEESLVNVTASSIYAEVDYTGMDLSAGTREVEVSFFVRSQNDCWCVGSHTIEVTLTENATAAETTAAE